MTQKQLLQGLILPVTLLALAEYLFRNSGIRSDSMAAPSEVFVALFQRLFDGSIIMATLQTLGGAMGGFAIGVFGGIALGILLALLKPVDLLLEVSIEALRPIPSIALLPIALLSFGFGYSIEFAIVGFACVFTAAILTRSAIRSTHPRLLEVAQLMGLGAMATIFKVIIPAAMPRIFLVLRLGASIALIVSVTVEITINPQGLGHAMMTASHALQPEVMLAYLIWLGIVGLTLNIGLLAIQRHLFGRMANLEAER